MDSKEVTPVVRRRISNKPHRSYRKRIQNRFSRFQLGPSNIFVTSRNGQVLGSRMILKADMFPSVVKRNLPLHLSGASNFRQVPGVTLYGVGQPTGYGIRSVLNIMKLGPMFNSHRQSRDKIPNEAIWINLREEPVVYLNNRPFVLRELDHPFRNMQDFRGLDAQDISDVERRLKVDILRESTQGRGNVLLHEEAHDGPALSSSWEALSDVSIRTSDEIYAALKLEGYKVDYYRVPITPEDVPEAGDFDHLVTIFLKHSKILNHSTSSTLLLPNIIFNCQRGTGRSILGIVTVYLTRLRVLRELKGDNFNKELLKLDKNLSPKNLKLKEKQKEDILSTSNEYMIILKLIRMLKFGSLAKKIVDSAIIHCSDGVHSLRKSIQKYIKKANITRDDANLLHLQAASASLLRYFILICFQGYLDVCEFDMRTNSFKFSFQSYLAGRPELMRLAELCHDVSFWKTHMVEKPLGTIEKLINSRKGAVLNQNTILKGEYVPSVTKTLSSISWEAPNFRILDGAPIAASGQPTVRGIKAILEQLGANTVNFMSSSSSNLWDKNVNNKNMEPRKVLWINFREEPVLFILGKPHVLREFHAPFRSMAEFTTGMSAELLHNLELRLKADALKELENDGKLLLHHEKESRKLSYRWQSISNKEKVVEVLTSAEVFDQLKNFGYLVEYKRIPLTVGRTPDLKSFDLLYKILEKESLSKLKDEHTSLQVVFNCFKGGRRSTMGMVITCLLLKFHGFPIENMFEANDTDDDEISVDEDEHEETKSNNNNNNKHAASDDEDDIVMKDFKLDKDTNTSVSSPTSDITNNDNKVNSANVNKMYDRAKSERTQLSRRRGEYKGILALVRILPQGAKVKDQVDFAIDICGEKYNLRETISEEVFRSENIRMNAAQATVRLNRAINYLESYAYLLCFNSFLLEKQKYLDKLSVITNENNKNNTMNKEESQDLTFSQWMMGRPELSVSLENIRKDADEMLKVGSFTSSDEFQSLYESRCGSVLTAGCIIKNDYFVGCRNDKIPQTITGTINFRLVESGLPIAGNGAPTAEGIGNLLIKMASMLYESQTTASTLKKQRLSSSINNNNDINIDDYADNIEGADHDIDVNEKKTNDLVFRGLWLNMREEPVVYLGFHPYVLREFDKPYVNLENTGITAKRVQAMEKQLKIDIIEEIKKNQGEILLHDEDQDGNLIAVKSRLTESQVLTPKEVYELMCSLIASYESIQSAKKYNLNLVIPKDFKIDALYVRMPITDEQAPSIESFDEIVNTLEKANIGSRSPLTVRSFFVTNCQMGRGRTTTTMIITYLWYMHRIQDGRMINELPRKNSMLFSDVEHSEVELETDVELMGHDNNVSYKIDNVTRTPNNPKRKKRKQNENTYEERLLRGEYKIIQAVVRLIKDGASIKSEVDAVIDQCDHMQNLRTAIYDLVIKAQTAVKSRRPRFIAQGIKYLARYFFLVCFNAYFRDQAHFGFQKSFKNWYEEKPELQHVLEKYENAFPPNKPKPAPKLLYSPTSPEVSGQRKSID